jgi:hypothetical protein
LFFLKSFERVICGVKKESGEEEEKCEEGLLIWLKLKNIFIKISKN